MKGKRVRNAAKKSIAKIKSVKKRQTKKLKNLKTKQTKKFNRIKNDQKKRLIKQTEKIKSIKPLKKTPTYLTLLNLVCGFLGMTFAIAGKYNIAVILIIGGFIFDILDGLVARMFHLTSDLGLELDSLADAITFVVTPALIVYLKFFTTQKLSIIVAIFIVIFGIYRLAKFNVSAPSDYFSGLPTPFFATIIISLMFIDIGIKEEILALLIIIFAYLMISPIKYPNFKNPSVKKYRYLGIFLLIVLVIGLLIKTDYLLLAIIMHGLAWLCFGIPLLIDKSVQNKKDIVIFDAGLILLTIAFYQNTNLLLFLPFIYGIIASSLIERSFREKK